jgi:hypothetical protein
MITIDSDPKLNPIYIGAFILNYFEQIDFIEVEIESLYEEVKSEFNISYDVFTFTLDWLFLAGAIQLNEIGKISYATP